VKDPNSSPAPYRAGRREAAVGQDSFDAQDEIDHRREQLIAEIEGKLQQHATLTQLFSVRWGLR